MDVIDSRRFNEFRGGPVVIAIGAFDGLHLGHQTIIQRAVEKSHGLKTVSGVYSFSPHPQQILFPENFNGYIMSEEQKEQNLEKLGIDYFFRQKFTREFSQMDFKDFIKNILVDKLNVCHIVVGDDFRFGYHGSGGVKSLKIMGERYNFTVDILSPVKINKEKVSSTLIRNMVDSGQMDKIPDYMGRYYQIQGKVITGEGRGRKLGIPTANLKLDTEYIMPPRGVYAAYAVIDDKQYKGILNIGFKPTFAGKDYSIEIHIMEFSGDLYGKKLKVEMIKFIRPEKAFAGIEELVKQIKKDILYTDSLLCYNS